MDADPRWYESFFEEDWLRIAARSDEHAAADVDALVELLGIEPGAGVLDCPCGTGPAEFTGESWRFLVLARKPR